jgi:hypothetical protein
MIRYHLSNITKFRKKRKTPIYTFEKCPKKILFFGPKHVKNCFGKKKHWEGVRGPNSK